MIPEAYLKRGGALAAALMILAGAGAVIAASPEVSNVTAAQRPGTMLVDIGYDLSDADGDLVWVSLFLSSDGGQTFGIACPSVTGDVGGPLTPGPGKTVVWDARRDAPGLDIATASIRVFARDLPPDPYLAGWWRSAPDGSDRRPMASGDTLAYGEALRLEWAGAAPVIMGLTPEMVAAVDTVYPYDDGLLGYKWQLLGELGGNCVPTLEDCWQPRHFNEATGDSFSYFSPNTTLVFRNDGSSQDPFGQLLPSGSVAMRFNALDIAGAEVPEHLRDFSFVVNHDPQTIVLNGETDWAHPADPQVYPYYVLLNDPAGTRVPFAAGDRIPDRSYAVFKALMRDDPRDAIVDPSYEMGLTGSVQGLISIPTGGSFSFSTGASAVAAAPTWPAGIDGWAADTLGFLVGPNTDFTMALQAVDEHGRRDGTPATLDFVAGHPPCVQCVELLPKDHLPSTGDPDLPCHEGGAHPCFGDTTVLRVTTTGSGADDLQFLYAAFLAVDKASGFTRTVTDTFGIGGANYLVAANIYGLEMRLHGRDDAREAWAEPLRRVMSWRYQVDYAADPYNLIRDGGGIDDITSSTWGESDGVDIDPLSGIWRFTVEVAAPQQMLNLGPDVYYTVLLFTEAAGDSAVADLIFDRTTRQFSPGLVRAVAQDQTQCGNLPVRPARYNVFDTVRPGGDLPLIRTWRDCDLQFHMPEVRYNLPLEWALMSSGDPVVKPFRLILVHPGGEWTRDD